jgi:hypothetical protein
MKFQLAMTGMLVVAATVVIPSQANAACPGDGAAGGCAPTGAIFNMATAHPAVFSPDSVYTQFTTTFVATATSEFVSFALREEPAFFSFDDVSVTTGAGPNLLQDPGFESDTPANVGTNFPVGWSRWIQAVDTSAIGVVAGNGNNESCGNSGPHTGSYFWCDGSVQGYDALYQQLNGLTVGATYTVTFWVTDNSGSAMAGDPTDAINFLVYAGTALPTGAVPIGTPPSTTPLPGTIYLTLLGISCLGIYLAFRSGMSHA